MSSYWRFFLVWLTVFSVVWVIANWPRDGGALKPFLEWAGFPLIFAFWHSGQLQWFDPLAFVIDIALGLGVGVFVGALCAWSRCRICTPAVQP